MFERQYVGSKEIVQDGPRLSRLALVAAFKSAKFANQVVWFVNEVKRIKSTVDSVERNELFSNVDLTPSFRDEFSGTRKASLISKKI